MRLRRGHGAKRPLEGEANRLSSQALSPRSSADQENTGLFSAPGFSRVLALACASWLAGLGTLSAQEEIAHEFIPDLRNSETLVASEGPVPAAILYRGEILPAPDGGALRSDERPMTALAGAGNLGEEAGRRAPTFRPDRVTEFDATARFYSVFSPSVAPFKRVTALDGVVLDGSTPVLTVAQDAIEPVPVDTGTGSASDGFDRFWGSVVLDFSAGRTVPLPSVAPRARILNIRTEPVSAIRIGRDGADNFYVSAVGSPPDEPIRLTFLTEASQSYFNPERLPDARTDALAEHASPLPRTVARDAARFARELGLRRTDALSSVLPTLVDYFRGFDESDDFPEERAGIYLDLARARRGVCRHRAYAFVITALGLGIPARFVMNEAHAWVEVALPELGWARIDLGGAVADVRAHNTEGRPRYEPVHPDPFPRPEAYLRALSQMRERTASTRSRTGGSSSQTSTRRPGEGRPGRTESPRDAADVVSTPDAITPTSDARIRLTRDEFNVFRGRNVDIAGRVESSAGEGLAGLRVEILVANERERLLGVTVSGATGDFRGSFGVPPDLPVGDYRLIVRTPGDDRYGPAEAR